MRTPPRCATDPNSGHVYVVDRATIASTSSRHGGLSALPGDGGSPTVPPNSSSAAQQRARRAAAGPGSPATAWDRFTEEPERSRRRFRWRRLPVQQQCAPTVHARTANRVQKFDADGELLLIFGREVNLTEVARRESQEQNSEPVTVTAEQENICTAASGDQCGAGTLGSGDGQFGTGTLNPLEPPSYDLAVGPGPKSMSAGRNGCRSSPPVAPIWKRSPWPERQVRSVAALPDGRLVLIPHEAPALGQCRAPQRHRAPSLHGRHPAALEVAAQTNEIFVLAGAPAGDPSAIEVRKLDSACTEDTCRRILAGSRIAPLRHRREHGHPGRPAGPLRDRGRRSPERPGSLFTPARTVPCRSTRYLRFHRRSNPSSRVRWARNPRNCSPGSTRTSSPTLPTTSNTARNPSEPVHLARKRHWTDSPGGRPGRHLGPHPTDHADRP